MPGFLLKRQILMNLPSEHLESEVAHSIDFMVERVCDYSLYVLFCAVFSIIKCTACMVF